MKAVNGMKQCSKCREVKSVASFGRHADRPDGLRDECRACRAECYRSNREKIAERKAEHYRNNREKIAERTAEYYRNNREKIAERKAEYYRSNREKIAERKAEYRRNNPSVERRSRETRRLRNAAMAEVATRSGQPWTPHEDARLLASAPYEAVIKAAELGRTIGSVRHRRQTLLRKRLQLATSE